MRKLRRNEQLDSEQLDRMQARYLHKTLQTAIARLPFYSHISPAFSVDEARDVLHTLFPIITKETLLANPATLYPHGGARRPWEAAGKTSGTTGTPLVIYRSIESLLLENAFVKRHWTWAGYEDGMPRATLRGDMVVGLERKEPPFWFWNRYNQQLLLSSRHLTSAHVGAIIDRLESLSPPIMQAYPSTAFTLATYLARSKRQLRIPHVFTASEPLYPHQRELILERLGLRIMDMYGMAERVAFATQCEHGEMHINPDYSYVEIVDEQGRRTDDYGYVVGTTFHNQAMPLVRYRLSDRTRWKPGRCACGRSFPMIESVTGKYEDSITGSNAAVVSPSVLTFAFKGVEHIRRSQVAQVGPARWEVRLVPFPEFSAADQNKLVDNIHTLVDPHVDVKVVLATELPDTAAGKFRWVVNETAQHTAAAESPH
ncbi:phenylacetate--CoA ligase family protein [Massilia niastensis]|uniref:phenylacetate--CoA ligase family protein n=1 Tax=Massilia niastensis TaxID=544911 RepID=UPI000371DE9B|nr:phenylacetate--CoA ligase family protein [Massilia niastensis]